MACTHGGRWGVNSLSPGYTPSPTLTPVIPCKPWKWIDARDTLPPERTLPRKGPVIRDTQHHSHPCGQTNTYENITFPQLCWRSVKLSTSVIGGIVFKITTNSIPNLKYQQQQVHIALCTKWPNWRYETLIWTMMLNAKTHDSWFRSELTCIISCFKIQCSHLQYYKYICKNRIS